MKKRFLPVFILITIALSTSCKKQSIAPDVTKTIVLPANGSDIINASNKFAFNFLHEVLKYDNTGKNKLISPLSIYLALSMTYNGADNVTKDSMAKALQLQGIDINSLNAVCKALISQLPGEDNKVNFSIANSIWCNKDLQPLSLFTDIVKNSFEATVQSLDFTNSSSASTINSWVSDNTKGKIDHVIDATSSGDLMYLINAIYFNGSWRSKFPEADTHTDNFRLQDGSLKQVPFMQQTATLNFYSNNIFSMVELPYSGGNSYSMYVLLPADAQQPLNAFAASIDENVLNNAISQMDTFNFKLTMPKWEYAYSVEDMKPELAQLGMGIAFSNAADFSKMYSPAQVRPSITKALHKTYIKVNEEGTEAAAVTVIVMGTTSTLQPSPIMLDRPFLYAIIEKQTGAILFTGTVNDPSLN